MNIQTFDDLLSAARSQPLTWLTHIARNRAIDRLRSLKRRGHSRTVKGEFFPGVTIEG